MDYVFKSKKVDNFVNEMKANYFDVDNIRQRHMNIIEGLIGNAKDEGREIELQQLWADYHEAERQCRLAVNRMIKAMEQIDSCFQSYHKKIYQVEGTKNFVNQLQNDKQEEVTETENVEVTNVSDNAIAPAEVVSPVAVPEEAPAETVIPAVVPEETPAEAVIPAAIPEETKAETVIPTAIPEETKAETVIPTAIPEETKAEAVIPAAVPEETKTEAVIPAVVPEEAPAEAVIPAVVPEEAPAEAVIPAVVPVAAPEATQDNKMVFVKNNTDEAKAIVINMNQKNKLSSSLATQKSLVNSILLPQKTEEISSEQQVENLMNQLPTLYEQGKVEEAEKISEQIRSLSKSVAPSA